MIYASLISLTLAGSKCHKGDELPHSRPSVYKKYFSSSGSDGVGVGNGNGSQFHVVRADQEILNVC